MRLLILLFGLIINIPNIQKGIKAGFGVAANKSVTSLNSKKPTLHKIWVFKEIKHVKNSVGTMFNVPIITLMDFRDQSTLRYEINDSVQSVHYEVEMNHIRFKQEGVLIPVSYRIEKLTKRTLELILVIDYTQGDNRLQGDLVKLIFNQIEK
ncbi:hypothetical protein TH61_10260 [Rufibacter sp. DG15C]|uniref:hypothetical protein n=1 Tax=Rufibacter sp. DG15C TaxID=1379909 RepID=UPI00078B22D1|nr:hypothetical protein [Rufibacter sp. DG15C]AMM51477.1 hypothetical protein TH61_10260 [Rufibacter sp. DG15C]